MLIKTLGINFILLTISIVLHELGHWAAARCFRIRVKRFCIFYDLGCHLFSTGKRFATEFRIGWLPLGGYVSFDIPDGEHQPRWSIMAQRPWKRLVVYLAGVAVNLLLAFSCTFIYVRSYMLPPDRFSTTEVIRTTTNITVNRIDDCRSYIARSYLPKSVTADNTVSSQVKETAKVHKHHKHKKPTLRRYIWCILHGMARLNTYLFLFNLLPIPPLDGAQALFAIYEMVFRRPLNEKVKIVLCLIGLLILLGLMALDTYSFVKDILCIQNR